MLQRARHVGGEDQERFRDGPWLRGRAVDAAVEIGAAEELLRQGDDGVDGGVAAERVAHHGNFVGGVEVVGLVEGLVGEGFEDETDVRDSDGERAVELSLRGDVYTAALGAAVGKGDECVFARGVDGDDGETLGGKIGAEDVVELTVGAYAGFEEN